MEKRKREIQIATLIGCEAELQGDFSAKGSARIDGNVNGNVTVEGNLIIGAGAVITGNITANAVLVGGEVNGNVSALQKAELTATAKVIGDITTAVIVIDERAVFQGKCDMSQAALDRRSKINMSKALRLGKKSAKEAIEEALKEVAEEERREAQKEDK